MSTKLVAIQSVLTYNFDDLLEREIKARGLSYRSIFEEVDLASPEELPIYHVHGFLPENREEYQNINKATLVFSEEGYHHIYREAYHWSNLIQLNSLKETSCLRAMYPLAVRRMDNQPSSVSIVPVSTTHGVS